MLESLNNRWSTPQSYVLLAMVLSAVIHAASAFSYLIYQQYADETLSPKAEKSLQISFKTIIPQSKVTQKPAEETVTSPPEPVEPVQAKPEPKPTPQPVIADKSSSKPKSKKTKQIARPAKPVTRQKKIVEPAKTETKVTKQQAVQETLQQPSSVQPLIAVGESPSAKEIEEIYITSLLNQVEKNKFYPRKARRRNIEGKVKVTLSLNADGSIVNLNLSDGHKILRKAADKAIQKSLPFDRPPATLISPKKISFEINYRFKNP